MFNRILVAIDGADHSRQVIPTAVAIARQFKSDVYVLHVSEHDRGRAAVYSTETPAEVTKLVADAVKAIRAEGITAKGDVMDAAAGHVAKYIVDTARTIEANLIVMGSRGLSDVEGLFMGSVTHQVLQQANTAVLIARGPVPAVEKAAEKTAEKAAEPVVARNLAAV